MRIGVDINQLTGSHEKSNDANHKWLLNEGHGLVPLPLPYGDYCEVTADIQEIIDRRGMKLSKIDLVSAITISVDRKNSIDEICGNICGSQHDRFREEAIRAKSAGAKFYVLIENDEGITDLDGIKHWSNPRLHRYNKINYMHKLGKWKSVPLPKRPPTANITLFKAMYSMAKKYDIIWVFCKPQEAGTKIVELLKGELDG